MFDSKTKINLYTLLINHKSDISHYPINNEVSPDDFDGYDILIETCIVIPKDNLSILINIEKVDQKGVMHFDLFGVSDNINKNNRHISLSEISFFDNQIIYVNDIMKLNVDEEIDFIKEFSTPEEIHHVCTSMLNYYFCNRYLRSHSIDTYICGEMCLRLN